MAQQLKAGKVPNGFVEYKSVISTAEIKDVDVKNRIVTGYWANFDNLDYDEDIIKPGAFTKTIAERGPQGSNEIFFLWQHNWATPLGKPNVLREDSKGLYHETPCTIDTTYGDDALKLMAGGLVIQNSIGFSTVKWNTVNPDPNKYDYYREILEVKLYEGSAVTLGANDQTPFTGFKSFTKEQIDDQISKIVKLNRNEALRDETHKMLEFQLKQLVSQSFILGQKSLEGVNEPLKGTQTDNEPTDFYSRFATNQQKSVYTFNI